MAETPQNRRKSITWSTKGKRLNQADEGKPSIEVTEYDSSINMEGITGTFGIPINAPLAVQLIQNLWKKMADEPCEWLKPLLERSRAITIDRSVLLKTISQPGCEGVRFYLCLKTGTDQNPNDVLSLVTVGVDASGKDLLYDFDESVHRAGIQSIPTTSMIAEYGFPPGALSSFQDPASNMDPLVLFRYSQ